MNQKVVDMVATSNSKSEGGQTFSETQKACFSVNLEKMTAGIGTIFTGVMQLLAALEHDPDGSTVENTTVKGGQANARGVFVGDMVDHGHDADRDSDAPMSTVNPAVSPGSVTADAAKARCEQKGGASNTTLTADDISKVVIQKIKQDRAKGPAIGALLKNYGADHIGKLATEHYESFMTEVAQL